MNFVKKLSLATSVAAFSVATAFGAAAETTKLRIQTHFFAGNAVR